MIKQEKVVIIGSGLGGLSSGVILAKNGYDVTVLEQGNQIGGCLQCFTRHGAKFETGMHFIGSAAPGQTLNKLMKYLEIDEEVTLSQLDSQGYDVVALGGKQYQFANGKESFIKKMSEYFPDQHANLVKYCDLVEDIANASSLHSLKYAESDAALNMEYQLRSINEVIDEIITDPTLAKVLVGNLPLYAAEKDKTPFSTHAFIMDFYNQSAFRVKGGSDKIAFALTDTIKRYGGEVLTKKKVTKIICDESHAVGVEVNNEDSVYLHFKDDAVPYLNYNYYGYQYESPWDCEKYTEESWPKGFLYMHFCPDDDTQYASTGVILSYMQMSDVEKWKGTSVGKRGKAYEEFKKAKAEKLLSVLEMHFPGIRSKIQTYYTSTPLTYLDYTGTEGGSMYGNAKDINLGSACRVPQRTKVPNVYLTGQNINSHGMLGVLVGAIVTCSELLSAKTIYEQIKEANK